MFIDFREGGRRGEGRDRDRDRETERKRDREKERHTHINFRNIDLLPPLHTLTGD